MKKENKSSADGSPGKGREATNGHVTPASANGNSATRRLRSMGKDQSPSSSSELSGIALERGDELIRQEKVGGSQGYVIDLLSLCY